jgi:hypothetical protein
LLGLPRLPAILIAWALDLIGPASVIVVILGSFWLFA